MFLRKNIYFRQEEWKVQKSTAQRNNLMLTNKKIIIILAILFVLLIVTPVGLNIYYNFLLKPVSTSVETQIFVIRPGTPVVAIAEKLAEKGLIKNVLAFRLLVTQTGIGKQIQAGDFRLFPSMTSREIAQELTHGAIDIWITLPEGLRIEEQAATIEKALNFKSNELYQFNKDEYVKIAEEGFMFPDTYLIPKDATAADVATLLRNTFDQKVKSSVFDDARKNGLTENQLITLASLIQREAKPTDEKQIIAGILVNRLQNGIALQVDATVQYAKGFDESKETWWPQITQLDYQQVLSSYNTYLSSNLPPGPIANPGLDSIQAAANPQDTDFFYYLHDSEGNIHYAVTIEEHNQNVQKYIL